MPGADLLHVLILIAGMIALLCAVSAPLRDTVGTVRADRAEAEIIG
jgi:hypothetical protein